MTTETIVNLLWTALLRASLWLTLAALLVLLLTPWLRRRFGAELAYRAWWLLPLTLLVSLLPRTELQLLDRLRAQLPALLDSPELASAVDASASQIGVVAVLMVWLAGALIQSFRDIHAQRRYLDDLQLRPHADHWRADAPGATPALLGALRPRLVLPADFEQRYSAEQQQLVRCHEAVHARRGDPLVNLASAVLCALFWFHPLAHLARRALRRDQELACDAAVMRLHPHSRRAYAQALLNTQLDRPGLPVGCTWQSSQPLKQRLNMLKQSAPSSRRSRLGLIVLTTLGISLALTAWAGPAPTNSATWEPTLVTDGKSETAPRYPAAALAAGQAGEVNLELWVNRDGSVKDVRVASATLPGVFDEAALAYVQRIRFDPAPASFTGQAVQVQLPISFRLIEEKQSSTTIKTKSVRVE